MTRENALKLWPVIKAYGEGKSIVRYSFGHWIPPSDELEFSQNAENYRVKQNPNRTIKDGLEYGDVIVNKQNEKRKVLGVCGMVVITSINSNFNKAFNGLFTLEEFIENGWKLSTEEAPNKVTLTKQAIADKFGCDVNDLEIKE